MDPIIMVKTLSSRPTQPIMPSTRTMGVRFGIIDTRPPRTLPIMSIMSGVMISSASA